MELRTLEYFLAVAENGSISAAATALHLSQPTLSRQLKELEQTFGKTLLIRGNKNTTLTEDGLLLQKRAKEILTLAEKTTKELQRPAHQDIAGDVWIGGGESEGMEVIAKVAKKLKQSHPKITINIISANASDTLERLEKGLIDFAIGIGPVDQNKYDSLWLPGISHKAGILMPKTSPLAHKKIITPADIKDKPLITPRNSQTRRRLAEWLKIPWEDLNVAATFNLIYNATFLVKEGLGYAISWDKLINTTGDYPLCFIPLSPAIEIPINIAYKHDQVFSRAGQKFLDEIRTFITQDTVV